MLYTSQKSEGAGEAQLATGANTNILGSNPKDMSYTYDRKNHRKNHLPPCHLRWYIPSVCTYLR